MAQGGEINMTKTTKVSDKLCILSQQLQEVDTPEYILQYLDDIIDDAIDLRREFLKLKIEKLTSYEDTATRLEAENAKEELNGIDLGRWLLKGTREEN